MNNEMRLERVSKRTYRIRTRGERVVLEQVERPVARFAPVSRFATGALAKTRPSRTTVP